MRAVISVYVRGRGPAFCDGEREGTHGATRDCGNMLPCKHHPEKGEGPKTTGKEVMVTANGHLLPCRSIKLEVNENRATAILEVDVDEVHVSEVIGVITDRSQAKSVPDGS